jgi:hypothetical protein
MPRPNHVVLEFPTSEYRALPIPSGNGAEAKLATCFVRVSDLPGGLQEWMKVNPRVPKVNRKDKMKGPLAAAMKRTLLEEPEKFALMNQGMYILCETMAFAKSGGGHGIATVRLSDKEIHGLVNGGHTYQAIREAAEERQDEQDWDAYVRLHIMSGIDPADIMGLAEGLNRSMQVDDPSLENLKGTFDEIKEALDGKRGAERIAYRQGDPGEVDVQQVLQIMSLFDLKNFPDRKKYPNKLFGHQKLVLQEFIADRKQGAPVFKRILPRLHEILVLSDEVQKKLVAGMPSVKISGAKTNNRVASEKYKKIPARFSTGTIGGKVPLGWLYPALGALRANVSKKEWDRGRFVWLEDPKRLLEEVGPEMAPVIKQEHQDNKGKPGEVGRKEAAYRACYSVVKMALADAGMLE